MSALAQVQLECDYVVVGRDVCRGRTAPLTGTSLDEVRTYWRARGWDRGGSPGDGSLGDLCPRHARVVAGR